MEKDTKVKEKIKELKEKGIPVYSISKLNTLENCYYEYYQTYILKLKQRDNIYSVMGSAVHKCLEDLQNGECVDFQEEILKAVDEAKMLDLKFPSPSIEDKYMSNILNFAASYTVPDYKNFETETLFLTTIHGKYIQGIIDLLIINDDGSVDIIDYKTSSKFSNAELQEKGRQLILYGAAMEELGYKINSLAWNMLKYVSITYKLKNGKEKTTIAERGYIVEKLKNDILKRLKADPLNQKTDLELELIVEDAAERNSFSNLPSYIQEAYTIKDYIVKYEYNQSNVKELFDFIKAKTEEVEQFENDEEWWTPKEITKFSSFFCENLCGHKEHCQYYQDYIISQIDEEEVDEDEKELQLFL